MIMKRQARPSASQLHAARVMSTKSSPSELADCRGLPQGPFGLLTVDDWTSISSRLHLSTREAQIARLILDGMGEPEIGAQLHIAQRTVHAHAERLYRKLQIHSRHQLVTRLFATYLELRATPTPT
jgi:DNA-binding NarL/FixJ family response regulator